MAASMPRVHDDRDSGLDRFRRCTIAHPRLVEAKDELMNAIAGAESNSLVFVFGPTGVGKTTLLQKAEQMITAGLLTELQEDHERIPVVSVEAVAPESGNFNWRDHYKRLLRQLDEPLVDYHYCPANDGSCSDNSFVLWGLSAILVCRDLNRGGSEMRFRPHPQQ